MKKIVVRILACFIPNKHKRRAFRNRYIAKNTSPQYNIGKYSYYGAIIITNSETSIGKYCSLSTNILIGANQHPIDMLSTSPIQYKDKFIGFPTKHLYHNADITKPCKIGNDVWIGANVIIMDGVTIGDGAIVGSGAVVTHDVPPYAIVVGVPAKILRYRFDEKTIKQLLELKWWNLPEEQVAELPFDDIKACIQQIKKFRKIK